MDYAVQAFIAALATSAVGGLGYMTVSAYRWVKRKRVDRIERGKRAELGYQYGVENNIILRQILAELRPNGNSSMRDAIDRLERYSIVNSHIVMALADRSDVGVFIANKEGEWVNCNNILQVMLGVGNDELKGNRWRAFIHPQDREEFITSWTHAVEERYDFKHSCRMVCTTGEIVEVEFGVQLVPNVKDEVIALAGTIIIMN